jgi:hypothetical protein
MMNNSDQSAPRRRSISPGPQNVSFPPSFPPPRSDGGSGFNDPFNSSYQEVSGPPSSGYPPFGAAQGLSHPSMPSGIRDSHSYPACDSFDMNLTGLPPPPGACSNSYASFPLSDSPYTLDDSFGPLGRSGGGDGFGPPALLPRALPMTPHSSHYSATRRAAIPG